MIVGQRVDCLYCLAPSSYELKLDCKGRPFFICCTCGSRTFVRGEMALKGPSLLWGPITAALRAGDGAAAKVLVGEAVRGNA